MKTARLRKLLAVAGTHGFLLAASLVMVAPLGWMISTALRQPGATLSRQVEWLPWRDAWVRGGEEIAVIALGARVRDLESGEVFETSVNSLENRTARVTPVYLPAETIEGETLEFRVRRLDDEEGAAPFWIPQAEFTRRLRPQWSNFSEALEKMQFGLLLNNTLAVTFLGTAGTILSCSFVAFGFARFRFPGRDTLFIVLLSSMMLPPVVTMIPVYLIFRELGWIDTLLPLFAPAWFGVNAFAVFLYRQYYMTLPFDLDDAGRMDGCNALQIYWHVLLPLTRPVMATVGIFSFTGIWLDFLTPLIYLNTNTKHTLSLGLYTFKGAYDVQWNYLMAATLVVSAPCIVLFIFGQRYFVRGVVMSGLKG